jgi:ADP-ribosylglycohydrolase
LFNPPGCHQIRACFQKLKGEWVQRPVFYRSHHRGLWQIGWPEYSQGSDGPYVGYGEPTFTDDLAMALALAEESAAQEQKVRAQVEESERRRAELAKARADRHAEPTLEERLLAALREFVQQEIPEPVE